MHRDSFFLSLGIVFVGNAFASFLGFVRQVLFARWMDPAAFGVFGLALSLQNILLPVLLLGSGSSLVRFLSLYPRSRRFLLRSILPIPVIFTVIVTVFSLVQREWLSVLVFQSSLPDIALWTILTLPALAAYNLGLYVSQGQQGFRLNAAANVITSAAILVLGFLLVMPEGDKAGALIANLFSYLFGAIIVGTVFFLGKSVSEEEPPLSQGLAKEIWSYQGWFFLSEVFFSAANGGVINRWFINLYVSTEAAGIFFASLIFGTVIITGAGLLNSVLFPKLNERLRENPETTREKFKTGVFLILLLYVIFSTLLLFFKEPTLNLLLGEKYHGIANFLYLIIIAYGFFLLLFLNNAFLLAGGGARFSFYAFFLGTMVNAGANLVLTPSWGIAGSAISLGLGFGTTALMLSYRNATKGLLGMSYLLAHALPLFLIGDVVTFLRLPLFLGLLLSGVFILWNQRLTFRKMFSGLAGLSEPIA